MEFSQEDIDRLAQALVASFLAWGRTVDGGPPQGLDVTIEMKGKNASVGLTFKGTDEVDIVWHLATCKGTPRRRTH